MGTYHNSTAIAVTTDGASHVSGDSVGGLIEVTGMPSNGLLMGLRVVENGTNGVALNVWVFNEAPTTIADNVALNLSTADKQKCIGQFAVAAGDYITNNSQRIALPKIDYIPFETANNKIYLYLQATGTFTPGAATYSLTLSYAQGSEWVS